MTKYLRGLKEPRSAKRFSFAILLSRRDLRPFIFNTFHINNHIKQILLINSKI